MNEFLKYCKEVCIDNPSMFEAVKNGYKACFEGDEIVPVDPSKMDAQSSATASAQYAEVSELKKQEEELNNQINSLNQQKQELNGQINTASQSLKTTMDAASAEANSNQPSETAPEE